MAIVAYFIIRWIVPEFALIASGDIFFIVYLFFLLRLAAKANLDTLRRRARNDDEGILLIMALTVGAIAFSFYSIFSILNGSNTSATHLATAIISIPLGWVVFNTLFAFHYARLYYAPAGTDSNADGTEDDVGGLIFPDTPEPVIWDFFYFAFCLGATFQTSDVNVRTTDFRMVMMFHSIASFIFNTTLLALAINLGASVLT
ncbi:DUF1345 domain-containing protein [Kaistia terrae]|uniref:DUF1345 domain-containing protein n=1 Tax=Kaistia terrae TaxID=537017 RepID=A0ABW0PW28_9HYPH|nr:DUF1345 domain-containing protein [Kaistia terrae]MCX5579138.1 DUF1345 domain-containing protein [Kaistia terrae]